LSKEADRYSRVKDTARLLRYPEARSGVRRGSLEPDATTVRREPNVSVQHVCSFLARIAPSTLHPGEGTLFPNVSGPPNVAGSQPTRDCSAWSRP
jgi:hypothetical protein